LRDKNRRIMVQSQPEKKVSETLSQKTSQRWRHMPVIPATLEVEESWSKVGLGKSRKPYQKNKLKQKNLRHSSILHFPSKCEALCSNPSISKKKETKNEEERREGGKEVWKEGGRGRGGRKERKDGTRDWGM
jgi:hypothetical protein